MNGILVEIQSDGAVRIPEEMLTPLGLQNGDHMLVSVVDGARIMLTPVEFLVGEHVGSLVGLNTAAAGTAA